MTCPVCDDVRRERDYLSAEYNRARAQIKELEGKVTAREIALGEVRARLAIYEQERASVLEATKIMAARLALAERVIDAAAVVHRDCDTKCRCDRWAPADAPPCVDCAAWERLDSAMLAYDAALTGERAAKPNPVDVMREHIAILRDLGADAEMIAHAEQVLAKAAKEGT
ncbi:MAG TPA: hypothetical protein VEJ18_03585 [Planctomycetota bacterium]|nr:hypothetical protein [Planctomycetota bacterium]